MIEKSISLLEKFAAHYREGAAGCEMEWDVAQDMALAIDEVLPHVCNPLVKTWELSEDTKKHIEEIDKARIQAVLAVYQFADVAGRQKNRYVHNEEYERADQVSLDAINNLGQLAVKDRLLSKVKPLVWKDYGGGMIAHGIIGHYYILPSCVIEPFKITMSNDGDFSEYCKTIEAGQEFAQQDHNRRVRGLFE